MPPNEPIKESLEEILARVSQQTDVAPMPGDVEPLSILRMTSTFGAWWQFSFRCTGLGWSLVECTAPSANRRKPHDLLGPVYGGSFRPFLSHVITLASGE